MRQRTTTTVILGLALAALVWWLVRRLWLAKEGAEAEPPPLRGRAPVREPGRGESVEVDPVDEAIAESFPASDPPSFAGARGHGV